MSLALRFLLAGQLIFQSLALSYTRCPSLDQVMIPLVSVEKKERVTYADLAAVLEVEASQEVYNDVIGYTESDSEDPVSELSLFSFGDSVDIDEDSGFEKGGDGEDTQALFLIYADGETALVDCLKVVTSDYFRFRWYGRICRGKVNEKVKEVCTYAYTNGSASLIGIGGAGIVEQTSVSDKDKAATNIYFDAEAEELLAVSVSSNSEFTTTKTSTKSPDKEQTSSATNQLNVESRGGKNTVTGESTTEASGGRAVGALTVSATSESSSRTRTRTTTRRPVRD